MILFIKKIFLRSSGTSEAALLLGLFTLFSQLLGLVRDRLLVSAVGIGANLDVYYTAFRIPDFLYASVATLASVTVILPYLHQRYQSGERDNLRAFISQVFSALMIFLIAVSSVLFIIMPMLAPVIAPGFDQEQLLTLISVSRIMLIQPILIGISNMFGSVSQLFKKFFVVALSPVMYNIGIIIGIVWFYPIYGPYGLAYGVVLGALLHLCVQLPVLYTTATLPRLQTRIDWQLLRDIIRTSLPRTAGLSLNLVTMMVITAVATGLGDAMVSVFMVAYNIWSVPVNFIGVSFATAGFTTLVESVTANNTEQFKNTLRNLRCKVLILGIIATVGGVIFHKLIIQILLGLKGFTPETFHLAGGLLIVLLIGLVAQSQNHVSIRALYALQRTRQVLYAVVCAELVTILLVLAVPWKQYQTGQFIGVGLFAFIHPLLLLAGIFVLGVVVKQAALYWLLTRQGVITCKKL